ncbi:hypothetical protein MBM_03838 [Drepanopeziza brunnea f. sp. 'multigermtubi' MB_m1]|uniref:Uncharacterized protein n=1 Tax=Marssonina brunnea f. sp. multigermtubi (strain MB_m1) TaxID=1072389 RepID=K1WYG5_MARBU|nr:uncharacterized protein MBM_03838 [Drepanopeziza brunnea f. sp. 'multigermtubi' MB_m1]EKD18066.1 hypothetical protein MBM_03838 [Drepanopeziza brunnea f. sp. 'multigermtubi' MB_m1]
MEGATCMIIIHRLAAECPWVIESKSCQAHHDVVLAAIPVPVPLQASAGGKLDSTHSRSEKTDHSRAAKKDNTQVQSRDMMLFNDHVIRVYAVQSSGTGISVGPPSIGISLPSRSSAEQSSGLREKGVEQEEMMPGLKLVRATRRAAAGYAAEYLPSLGCVQIPQVEVEVEVEVYQPKRSGRSII